MKHIPNILSVIRILLIPAFISNVVDHKMTPAGYILILSGITDVLDGYLARRNKWITNLGKVLDPVADKLTQITVAIAFILVFNEYAFVFWIVLFKEAFMMIMSAWLMKKGAVLEGAKWYGKVATIVFYCSVIIFFLFPNLPLFFKNFLMFLVLAFTLFSAINYIPEFKRHLDKTN